MVIQSAVGYRLFLLTLKFKIASCLPIVDERLFYMNGAFQIARKSIESDIWRSKPSSWWKIWCYILACVQHTDFKELKRGQGFFNFKEIIRIKDIGNDITYPQIDHMLRWARQASMLATRKATHGMVISVLRYNLYQDLNNYKSEVKSEDSGEVEAKQKRNESDNINKNDKNVKNVKNDKEITNVIKEFGNPDINKLVEYFPMRMQLPKEDCSQRQSRQYWNLLLKESRTGVAGVKWLIDLAYNDEFYKNNISSSKDLYYKRIKIIARKRGEHDGSKVSIDISKI